jgi:hypothetical protein
MMRGEAAPSLYELRLRPVPDARIREAVADRLAARFPSHEASALARALGGAGLALRVRLADADTPALLRELYATGLPPVAVVLRPAPPPSAADPDADRRLALFAERNGRFMVTWNWRAFLFGPLWYLRKGLYAKGLVLLALVVLPLGTLATTVLVSLAAFLYCGLMANWDYYLWSVERKQWW